MYEIIYCVWVVDESVIGNPKNTSFFMTTEYETAMNEFNKLYQEMNGCNLLKHSYFGDFINSFSAGEDFCITVRFGNEGWIEDNDICYPDPTKPGQGKLLRIPF